MGKSVVWPAPARPVYYPEPESRPQQTLRLARARPYLDGKRCPYARRLPGSAECIPVPQAPGSATRSGYAVPFQPPRQLAGRVPSGAKLEAVHRLQKSGLDVLSDPRFPVDDRRQARRKVDFSHRSNSEWQMLPMPVETAAANGKRAIDRPKAR